MRWAASRKTTQGEDRAYSLMGIFGVNFSIMYGEGAERAFFRLIEAIISSRHTSHVIQILHWAGRAVSDRIHISRLIPSGPEFYHQNSSKADTSPNIKTPTIIPSTLTEPMVLTHLGLRVKLLILQLAKIGVGQVSRSYMPLNICLSILANYKSISGLRFRRPDHVASIFLDKRFPKFPTKNSLFQFYHPQVPTPDGESFFLGIYTFKEDNEKNCIYLPISSCAFFLGIPTPKPNFSISDNSQEHFEPTSKIDTRAIVQLPAEWLLKTPTQGDIERGFFTIERELLESMCMKVFSVYL